MSKRLDSWTENFLKIEEVIREKRFCIRKKKVEISVCENDVITPNEKVTCEYLCFTRGIWKVLSMAL